MNKKLTWRLASTLLACFLSACGGGGGGGDSGSSSSDGTPANLSISGTAATGLAIAGATINAKCQVGSGVATTIADGSYQIAVAGGNFPCLLEITNPVDNSKLHTVATGTGSTATANITPLTEMATARILGSEPNVFFAAFDAALATQKISPPAVQAAQTDVVLILTGTVDSMALGNFISAPLKAATQVSPSTGDAHDKLLDALKLKLSNAQIDALATAFANNQTTDAIKQLVVSMTTAPTTPPTANAGAAQSVVTGTTVTLDASTSSASAGKSLTYAWTLISKPVGSAASLAAPATVKPTFVADVAGSYVISVIVNDGTTASSAAAVSVTASVVNAAPVAKAGVAQNVVAGNTVTLDGSASSDANNDPLTYAWTLTSKPAGSTAALTSANSAKPTFKADLAGTYVASLTANDGKVNSAAVTVRITAAVANVAPVANAGVPQSVVAGMLVNLNGSASSDANGDMLTYEWTLISKPVGSSAVLTGATSALSTFIADVAGTYVASLKVSDGKLSSNAATIAVTAAVANVAPVANAGVDQNVVAGAFPYYLNGSGSSDANGDALTYHWTFVSVPPETEYAGSSPQPFYSGQNTAYPVICANVPGTYVVSLVVNDGKVSSAPSTVTITASATNLNSPPSASAGRAQSVMAGSAVTLDGSASHDANGDPLTYSWTLIARPTGSTATLSSSTAIKPTFTADLAGSYVATLVVNDGKVNSSTAPVSITAAAHSLTLSSTPQSTCLFNCYDVVLSLPYVTTSTASGNSTCIGTFCPTAYTVAAFKLRAAGQSYTITNLQARNLTNGSAITPFFSGLTNGQTIADGQTVTFSIQSPFTGGSIVNLNYSFAVLETGATFNYTIQLQTN